MRRTDPSRLALPLLLAALAAGLLPGAGLATNPATSSIVVTSTADTVAADGVCTLREALLNADNDSQFVPGAGECAAGYGTATITFAVSGPIQPLTYLLVGSPTVIDGGTAGMTLDGAAAGTLLVVGGAATLRHLRIQNSVGSDSGAVVAYQALQVEDCVFANNSAAQYGGALNASAPIVVLRSTFTGNHAVSGGAIVSPSAGASISDSTFSANTSTGDAGALVLGGTTSVLRSSFTDNGAGGAGGAVLVVGGASTIDSSTFTSNTSKGGGAVTVVSGSLSIAQSTLTGNSVSGTTMMGMASGGALYLVGGTTTSITDSTITGSAASGPGGAIASWGTLTLTGSTLTTNTSGSMGGGLLAYTGSTVITESAVRGNTAPGAGGIAVLAGQITLTDAVIQDNTATGAAPSTSSPFGASAGGLGIQGAKVTLAGTSIADNMAAGDGGGANLIAGQVTMTTTTISGNTSQSGSGGGMALDLNSDVTVRRSTISGNAANNGGGIFSAGALDMANSTIALNHATGGGGALTGQGGGLEVTGTTILANVTIARNVADGSDGGGLLAPFPFSVGTLVNSLVVGNTKGGGVASDVSAALDLYHHNVIGIPEGKTLADILDDDGLADNGGPTKTIGIADASPARDAGEVMVCISAAVGSVDQRGRARTSLCDIGAVEEESVAPTSTTPIATTGSGVRLPAGVPVRLTWTGADDADGVGIDHYDIQRSVNGGAWTASGTASTATAPVSIAPTGTTRFRVRAVDRDGNLGAWHAGSLLQGGSIVQQGATSIRWSGTWSSASSSSFSGGSVRWARTAGASATFRFTGRGVAVVSTRASNRGKVRIYAGTTLLATVDLAGATAYRQVVWAKTWSTSAARSIRVVVVGTSGRPRVDVDAFVVLK